MYEVIHDKSQKFTNVQREKAAFPMNMYNSPFQKHKDVMSASAVRIPKVSSNLPELQSLSGWKAGTGGGILIGGKYRGS